MTQPTNRQNAAKARGSFATPLRQKHAKVRPHKRRGARVTGFTRATHHSPRQQTASGDGRTPTSEKLASFRLWMFDAGMMASKKPEYRQQIAEACRQFDDYLAKNSHVAKGRRRGSNFTVGRNTKPKARTVH